MLGRRPEPFDASMRDPPIATQAHVADALICRHPIRPAALLRGALERPGREFSPFECL